MVKRLFLTFIFFFNVITKRRQETGWRELSHISWQCLLMVNINDALRQDSVTTAWQRAWRHPLMLHVTRGRDTSRFATDNCCWNKATIICGWRIDMEVSLWFIHVDLAQSSLKGSCFCDNFLRQPKFVPINETWGQNDAGKHDIIIICGLMLSGLKTGRPREVTRNITLPPAQRAQLSAQSRSVVSLFWEKISNLPLCIEMESHRYQNMFGADLWLHLFWPEPQEYFWVSWGTWSLGRSPISYQMRRGSLAFHLWDCDHSVDRELGKVMPPRMALHLSCCFIWVFHRAVRRSLWIMRASSSRNTCWRHNVTFYKLSRITRNAAVTSHVRTSQNWATERSFLAYFHVSYLISCNLRRPNF